MTGAIVRPVKTGAACPPASQHEQVRDVCLTSPRVTTDNRRGVPIVKFYTYGASPLALRPVTPVSRNG